MFNYHVLVTGIVENFDGELISYENFTFHFQSSFDIRKQSEKRSLYKQAKEYVKKIYVLESILIKEIKIIN